jgi:hypothetical protein
VHVALVEGEAALRAEDFLALRARVAHLKTRGNLLYKKIDGGGGGAF